MLNHCQFIGRLGQDPETRFTQSGDPVCNFSIACDSGYGDKKSTEWVRLVAFKKTAELCGQYLQKGRQVYVSGRMQTRKWTNKDGQDVYTTEIIANEVKFLGDKGEGKPKTEAPAGDPFDGQEIPFNQLDWRIYG